MKRNILRLLNECLLENNKSKLILESEEDIENLFLDDSNSSEYNPQSMVFHNSDMTPKKEKIENKGILDLLIPKFPKIVRESDNPKKSNNNFKNKKNSQPKEEEEDKDENKEDKEKKKKTSEKQTQDDIDFDDSTEVSSPTQDLRLLLKPINIPTGFLGLKRFVRDPLNDIKKIQPLDVESFKNIQVDALDSLQESLSITDKIMSMAENFLLESDVMSLNESDDSNETLRKNLKIAFNDFLSNILPEIKVLINVVANADSSERVFKSLQDIQNSMYRKKKKNEKEKDFDLESIIYEILKNNFNDFKFLTNQNSYESNRKFFNEEWKNKDFSKLKPSQNFIDFLKKCISEKFDKNSSEMSVLIHLYKESIKKKMFGNEQLEYLNKEKVISLENKSDTQNNNSIKYEYCDPYFMEYIYKNLVYEIKKQMNESYEYNNSRHLNERYFADDKEDEAVDYNSFDSIFTKVSEILSSSILYNGTVLDWVIVKNVKDSCEKVYQEVDKNLITRIKVLTEDPEYKLPFRQAVLLEMWSKYSEELRSRILARQSEVVQSNAFRFLYRFLTINVPALLAFIIYIRQKIYGYPIHESFDLDSYFSCYKENELVNLK